MATNIDFSLENSFMSLFRLYGDVLKPVRCAVRTPNEDLTYLCSQDNSGSYLCDVDSAPTSDSDSLFINVDDYFFKVRFISRDYEACNRFMIDNDDTALISLDNRSFAYVADKKPCFSNLLPSSMTRVVH